MLISKTIVIVNSYFIDEVGKLELQMSTLYNILLFPIGEGSLPLLMIHISFIVIV